MRSPYLRAYSLVPNIWHVSEPSGRTGSLHQEPAVKPCLIWGEDKVGTRQSESLGGSAVGGGGVCGGHGVHNGFSLDDSEVILTCGESLSSRMMDAGRSEPDVDVHHRQMMGRLRQEPQLKLQQLSNRGHYRSIPYAIRITRQASTTITAG